MNANKNLPNPAEAHEYFTRKMNFTTGPVELERELGEVVVIDVRAAEDFRAGHIPGAISLPQEEWNDFSSLQRERTNVIYCYSQVCHLAATAALGFTAAGFPVKELEGGFEGWKQNGLPVETVAGYPDDDTNAPAFASQGATGSRVS